MTKTSKPKKKFKVKTKKSSKMKSKSKLTPSIPSQESTTSDNNPSPTFQRLLKKSLKINHFEIEEKVIRKARRSLNKLKKTGSPDEIRDAEIFLNNAIAEKEEAEQWLDPKLAIEKLTSILEAQILDKADNELIQETSQLIDEAKKSLALIEQGEKDALFFKLNDPSHPGPGTQEFISEHMDTDEASENMLPDISFQHVLDIDDQSSKSSNSDNDNGRLVSSIITQEQEQPNNLIESQVELDSGQKTPITGSSSNPSSNFMQQQLNKALNVISPQEKLNKIRQQARLNASRKKSIQKEIINSEVDSNKKEQSTSTSSHTTNSYLTLNHNICENVEEAKNSSTLNDDHSTASIHSNKSQHSNYSESSTQKDTQNNKKLKQMKLSVSRTYSRYYSIKLKIDKAHVPVQQLIKHLKMFYKQLQLIDPSIIIYAYENIIPSEAILKPNDIPTDISILKKFFMNVNIKPMGGHTWFQLWLGHDDSVSNILANMKFWSSEHDSFIYQKRLQEKFSVKEYWLLWSAERMDPNVLHQEVTQALSNLTKQTLQFSFSFGNVRKDPKFSNSSKKSTSKFNKAMIIEAKKEQKDEIHYFLGKIFSTNSSTKIMHMNMRMVPMIHSDLPSHTKRKVMHLIGKQEQYLSMLRVKTCTYLQEIDYFNSTLNTTLRDIIMQLETLHTFDKNGDPMKVFINVDYSDWHSCYLLTYPSHLEKEAEDYITQLPAFLHYVYGPEVLLMLTAEGQVQAQSSSWDPEKLCATSRLDLELDAVATETSHVVWLPDLQTEIIELDTSNLDLNNRIYEHATDADSISTFKPANDTQAPPIVSPTGKKSNPNPSLVQPREAVLRSNGSEPSKDAVSSLEVPL